VVHAVDPDVVVHWAAIRSRAPTPTVACETNVHAAKNVLDAAGRADARIVQASSDGAYGFFFADPTPFPDELPITEDHPLQPEDPYGLSKVTAEAAAGAVARREGVPAVSIRPSWIQFPGEYACRSDGYVNDADDAGAGNFWSYIDARDVADLVAAALADTAGSDPTVAPGTHEAVNCVAADNALGRPCSTCCGRRTARSPPTTARSTGARSPRATIAARTRSRRPSDCSGGRPRARGARGQRGRF